MWIRHEVAIVACLMLMMFATGAGAQNASGTAPCSSPRHHEFDFWLGDWDVYGAQGKLAGTNHITREHGGCVVHEHYANDRGYDGESFNVFDATRGVWHQTWVDSSGLLLVLEGGLKDGAMVLEGNVLGAAGKPVPQRITWTPRPDGTVRQLWQSQDPKGGWNVVFDGTYRRSAAAH